MGWFRDMGMFFFPANCLVCGKKLHTSRDVLCMTCEYNIPLTGYSDRPDNPVSQIFWGRVPVEMGTSLFRFTKGSAYQNLLHDLKYRGNRNAGLYLGHMLGNTLKQSPFFTCDVMIPVPLHRKRLRERGFNQSMMIARGVAEITGIPLDPGVLVRTGYQGSQTSKSRYDRFINVSGDFQLNRKASDMTGKKILLIDDVVTTGATLEACSRVLFNHFTCTILIATAACA